MEEENLTKRQKRELAKEKKKEEHEKAEKKQNTSKMLLTFAVVALIGFLGYKFVSWLTAPTPEVVAQPMQITESDWVLGDEEAEVTIVEYGDYQCPACASYKPILDQAVQEIEGTRLVYRHFPLVNIHPNAIPSAKAAEAAGRQGKFWEMHDKLYTVQDEWKDERNPLSIFETYAEELELDIEQFKGDYASSEVEDAVNADLASANSLGLNSTPSVFINGKLISLPNSYDSFRELIEQEKSPDQENGS